MKGLAIEKSRAEEVRRALLERGAIVKGYRPLIEGRRVIFPIFDPVPELGEEVERDFEEKPLREERRLKVPVDFIGGIAVVRGSPSPDELFQLLRKPNVKTVLLNRGVVGDYRVMDLEWIGGERRFDTYHRENGLTFYVDLQKAYFNPRIGMERARIADLVKDGEKVIDMFSGIGTFALNIASKKKALIYGVDKNLEAVKLMRRNVEINRKILTGKVVPINDDAKDVKLKGDRVIMNLPFHSLDFLDTAISLLEGKGHIHLYSIFKRGEEKKTIKKIEENPVNCEFVKEKGYSTTKAIGFFDLEKTG
jgi:tRNA (guanine37-N1)-methyltransferase